MADKQNGWFKRKMVASNPNNKEFKDNRERFRFFNKYYKQPPSFAFGIGTLGSVCFTIVGLATGWSNLNALTIALLITGNLVTIGFEQLANVHYLKYSKIANKRKYDNVVFNVRLNFVIRTIAMMALIISILAIVALNSTDGTLSKLW